MTHCKTKVMRSAYEQFRNTTATNLCDVYEHWSAEKEEAYSYCKELCNKFDAFDYGIISANTYQFTFGFCGFLEGREAFFYITRKHDRYIFLDELETNQ